MVPSKVPVAAPATAPLAWYQDAYLFLGEPGMPELVDGSFGLTSGSVNRDDARHGCGSHDRSP
jgi:hypothetical protein